MGIYCLFFLNMVEPCLTATSLKQSPHYYSHFFCMPSRNTYTFSCKETLVNTVPSRYYGQFFLAPW